MLFMRLAVLITFVALTTSYANSQETQQHPQIKTEQKSEVTPKNQNHSDEKHYSTNFSETLPPTDPHKDYSTKRSTHGKEEGSEFWPSVLGYKIKITDSLLVAFTFVLSAFTGLLWYSTEKLWEASKAAGILAEKQHQLLESQYITAHRPRLTIRRISLNTQQPSIEFIIANTGESRAKIIESSVNFTELSNPLPAIPPYSIDTQMIKAGIKEAGQSDSPELFHISDSEMNRLVQGWNNKIITNGESSRFYFFGYVKYMDDVGTCRQMAFCRKYNPSTKCFTAINNPEYEYAD